jgi:dTDP-L-rhamnose 4-epimerase
MKVLVTGGAGFIGSQIVDACVARGDEVLCVDSLDPGVHLGPPSYLNAGAQYCFADLRYWQPDTRFRDVEVIVHLAALIGVGRAAREPANVFDANCRGTGRLVEYSRRWSDLKRVIVASSFSVYGSNYKHSCPACGLVCEAKRKEIDLAAERYDVYCPTCGAETDIIPITEEYSPEPSERYGASKYMQELCFRDFERAPVNVVRMSSVYGSRMKLDEGEASLIARFARWILSGEHPRLYEDGRQIRDWVYVGDVVDAVLAIIDGNAAPSIINVCSGDPTRLTEACDAIASAYGLKCVPQIQGGYRSGDMRHCLGNPTRLKQLLGRDPVGFRTGAALAFDSFQVPGILVPQA